MRTFRLPSGFGNFPLQFLIDETISHPIFERCTSKQGGEFIHRVEGGDFLGLVLGDKIEIGLLALRLLFGQHGQQRLALQPVPLLCQGQVTCVTAPGIIIQLPDQPGTEGITVDIAQDFEQMTVILNQNGLVTSAKQLPVLPVGTIEVLGIDAIDVTHATRQIPLRGLEQQVIMVGHQAVSRNLHIPALGGLANDFQKSSIIIRLKKNILSSAAAIHDMVPRPGKFNTKWSAHGKWLISQFALKANGRLDPKITGSFQQKALLLGGAHLAESFTDLLNRGENGNSAFSGQRRHILRRGCLRQKQHEHQRKKQ